MHGVMHTTCDGLSHGDQIGLHAGLVLKRQVGACAAITCLDLVTDEKDVVFMAQVLNRLEVAFWWYSRAGNRLVSARYKPGGIITLPRLG